MSVRLALGLCVWLTCSATAWAAEPPKLDDLLARMPVLSTNNKAVQSCEIMYSISQLGPFSFCSHVAWDRNQGQDAVGAVIIDPVGDVPIGIFCRGEAFLYDIIGQRGIREDGSWPSLQLAIDEPKKRFNIGYGLTFGKKREESKELVMFDLASFLKNCQNPQWTEVGDSKWKLRADSETGKSHLVCDFDTACDYPLKTMSMRESLEDKQFINVQVVAVNEPVNEMLLAFPAESEFPDTLPILSQNEASEGNLVKKMTDMMHMMFAPMALHNQDARKAIPIFDGVDWDAAELKYAEMAPALKRLAPEARAAAKQ